jgi:DMSO/TMAO reductase YedYZ heme-binding membrane subunit
MSKIKIISKLLKNINFLKINSNPEFSSQKSSHIRRQPWKIFGENPDSQTRIFRKFTFFSVFIMIATFIFFTGFSFTRAAEKEIDYKDAEIIDSDLDGLTDEGEKQIYKTDPMDPDTDGDGILDGAEVLSQTDPLDNTSPRVVETITNNTYLEQKETPVFWYFTRASALLGYVLLYLSIFLGVSIRIPLLNKLIKPVYSCRSHCWISLQALIFAAAHGLFLLGDKFMNFKLVNILIPFYPIAENQMAGINPQFLALGILSFYLMLILVITSYARRFLSQVLWRGVHFLNIGLFVIGFIHALYMGTDLKSGIGRDIFIYANAFLAFLLLVNIFIRIWKTLGGEGPAPEVCEINPPNYENLRQSASEVREERDPKIFRGRI